jgi:anaerobic ribonucleoside-triphosphate reductase activating protein
MDNLKVHSILSESKVNGPGSRLVIWTQGCSKVCQGCFNPETWNPNNGKEYKIAEIYKIICDSFPLNTGITFTGGDPFEQPEALYYLLKLLNDYHLPKLPHGIIVYTGYTLDEILNHSNSVLQHCVNLIDLLIDGKYDQSLKNNNALAGSSNQNFHFNCTIGRGESRIPKDQILIDQEVEIHDGPDNLIQITGFPNVDRKFFKDKGLDLV